MQPEQQQRIMGYFIEEAKDHLNTIEQGLLNLQGTMADPELMNEVFRAAHSVKGGAAMLGLNSIQKTSHRLEDYFKVLKESPSLKPDRKLETLLLKVFDILKEHLEELQSPGGIDDVAAQASLTKLEPVFSEIEQHLAQIERQATTIVSHDTVIQSEAIVQDNALVLIFQNDVPAQLREMLQTFRQAETMLDARERLQDVCLGLQGLGDAFGLVEWSQLIETASRAIANPENGYRELAPLVITEIKQAQGLVLAGRAKEIVPSEVLQILAPVTTETAEMDLELADFFAIANSDHSDELDFSGFDFAATDSSTDNSSTNDSSTNDSSFDSLFGLPELSAANDSSLDGMFNLSGLEETPAQSMSRDRNGPDMGMEELNSLADLFEGEMPDLGATWHQEEIIDPSELSGLSNDALSEADDFASFLSDTSESSRSSGLVGRFSDVPLAADNAKETEEMDEFELPDFSEDTTEFGASPETSSNGTLRSTESAAFADLELDELDLADQSSHDDALVNGFGIEDEGSLDNLSELFAGLDDTDLSFSDALDLDGSLDQLSATPEPGFSTESLDSWDSLELETDLHLLEPFNQAGIQNGSASTEGSIVSSTDELKLEDITLDDITIENLELLGLETERDDALEASFFGERSDETSIEPLPFNESEISLLDDLALDGLLNEPSLSSFSSSRSIEASAVDELSFGEEEFSFDGLGDLTENEADDFSELFASEDSTDKAVASNAGKSEDPFSALLDFSSSEPSLEVGIDSLNGDLADLDELSDLLDFSSSEAWSETSASDFDLDDLDLNGLRGTESSEPSSEPTLDSSQGNLLDEFDFDTVEPKSDAYPEPGLTESLLSKQDDFADLSLELFGAEAQPQETVSKQSSIDELDFDLDDSFSDITLDDLDSLLADEEPQQDSNNTLLGMGIGAAAIAGAGFAAMKANSHPTPATNELDDLDDLLNEPSIEAAIDEDFNDLEFLLSDAPEVATAHSPSVSGNETDAEFGDLEKMLEEADITMGGSTAKNRAATPPGRRSARAAKGLSEQTMRVPVKHLDNLSNLVGELVVNRNSLEQDQERLRQSLDNLLYQVQQLSDVGQRMQDLYERSLLESSLLASRQNHRVPFGGSERNVGNGNSANVEYDPLEMDRFTGFHSLSQEMIELIVRVRESSSDIEFIVDETEQVTRMFRQVTTQLQEGLTRSRMVPFAQTADRLPRAVRDIAVKCGKQAELVIEGRDTLIDKMILEHLYDPMTHLVNNAITHGIEDPEVRRAAGKSPVGRITIRAFHQGNQTVLSVSDDGAGVDVERVRSKAIEKGLITAIEAKAASRLDIYDLLFHPGFSTKDQADDFSGRGVGMDVVRTSLGEIRGAISTDSIQAKGTTFTIRLPLTLSISKALCCISDRARIAFPMDGVEDMLDLPKERLQTDAEGNPCIAWRDTVLAVRPLKELLGYNRHLSRGTVYGGNQEDDMVSIVILRSAGTYLALQVDQVLGEQEIVIKQLEGPVPKPVGVAGATVLGDGRIMPIADVLELIDLSVGRIRRDAGSMWEQGTAQPVVEAVMKTEPMVLIVDDSITVRELLSMTFNKVGYRVEQARDGQEAWEKLRSGLPCDIVFCDIEMPRMDGLELLSRIQKDPNLANLPIAMLTSRGADRHRQMAASLGASGYFTKPYLEEALLDAAQRMLKGEVLISANHPGNS